MDDRVEGRLSDGEVEELVDRLEGLLAAVEQMPEPDGQIAREAVSALVDVYGEGLARLVRIAGSAPGVVRAAAGDELVGHLMVLHGLHPDPPEVRVQQAISDMQACLHGESVELASMDTSVARVSVAASGCGSGKLTSSVEDIILAAAPELDRVEATAVSPARSTFIPLETLRSKANG
jgi:hypothetical protein